METPVPGDGNNTGCTTARTDSLASLHYSVYIWRYTKHLFGWTP